MYSFLKINQLLHKLYYQFFDKFILYPLMSLLPKKLNIKFMNLGYLPLNWLPDCKVIDENDKKIMEVIKQNMDFSNPNLAHCFLYEKTLSYCPKYPRLYNKELLEVGCGLGGGIEWIKRSHPELIKIIGIDKVISHNKINDIVQGNAKNIPFSSRSFDIVLNVESSHLYSNMNKFLEEVCRVLKPDGYFCWSDLRQKEEIEKILDECEKVGLNLVNFKTITSQIIQGIQYTSAKYDALIDKTPWFIRIFKSNLRETYCAPGTKTYEQYISGKKQYAVGCWKRPNLS